MKEIYTVLACGNAWSFCNVTRRNRLQRITIILIIQSNSCSWSTKDRRVDDKALSPVNLGLTSASWSNSDLIIIFNKVKLLSRPRKSSLARWDSEHLPLILGVRWQLEVQMRLSARVLTSQPHQDNVHQYHLHPETTCISVAS